MDLLTAPLELGGEWGGSAPNDAGAVIARAREVSLAGVRLVSDQQPEKLRVDDHSAVPPYVWLHSDHPDTAWIVVDITARDWSKLAYQFGHELGHVLCNSWRWGDTPKPPTQWLEEAMVEAFSIRGLALLADSWEQSPPFPHDQPFAQWIRKYRSDLVDNYKKGTGQAPTADAATWFRANRASLEQGQNFAPPVILGVLAELENNKDCVADLGAVNRWEGRTGVPVEAYIHEWQNSCGQVKAPGILPGRVASILGTG